MIVTDIHRYHTKINHKTYLMIIKMPIYKWHVYVLFDIVSETTLSKMQLIEFWLTLYFYSEH